MKFSFRQILLSLIGLFILAFSCQPSEKEPKVEVPAEYLLAVTDLPDYEQNVDHAAFLKQWTPEFYHKGMQIYRTNCYSCHGNLEQPGSIPNSRQFWKESFSNGADPYAMYQTLSRGFGRMPPQMRLTPKEKYEVIHFIREEFIKDNNPDEYFEVTEDYIASLPVGDTLGPDPQPYQPWAEVDYGDFFIHTYDLSNTGAAPRGISGGRSPLANEDFRDVNFSYKGIAMRLDEGEKGVAAGNAFALFDHDLLRFSGFWTGAGFIDYEDILLNDVHNIFPRTVGEIQVETPVGPAWANPSTGSFADPRFVAVDGRPFGPLPRDWAHYKGLFYHGQRTVLKYTVGQAQVLETYDLEDMGETPIISRTLNISDINQELRMRVAPSSAAVRLIGEGNIEESDGFQVLRVPAGTDFKVKLFLSKNKNAQFDQIVQKSEAPMDLLTFTKGGPIHDPQILKSPIIPGNTGAAYEVDVLTLPQVNPWKSRMRPTGIDFLPGGDEAVVCTIDGEVFHLKGITQQEGMVEWRRIATGLFQPLGIKYHNDAIYVSCRDQIAILRDLNEDGETDYYESFNSDHQVTEHFHEFAMGLQTDEEGNFYYAKSGRHARTSLVPQHGTLIRVSPDGQRSEIIANGFRAANGVCLNPDGSFIVTDQEGYWNPMNRINWVEEGGFYGNMWGYGAPPDSSDTAMESPLCWIDSKYDRSPAELLWADSDQWGPLSQQLLNLSYGNGKIFGVMTQKVGGTRQGGMIELPVPQFPTGIMRGRFNPSDGQLYTCGMSAWATNQMIQVGGLYRVRYTGKPLFLPIKMRALTTGMELQFSDTLDQKAATDPANYTISTWDLQRSRRYGSDRYNLQELKVENISLSEDGQVLHLQLPEIAPTWVMEIKYKLQGKDGTAFEGAIQNTIYELEEK
ncbi:MAG: c-type cytochrome [Saprospiraceae bacterium]